MYKIIGADGKEYGPITAEQLKQWFTEGRVNTQTQVLAEGSTDWRPLGEFPELAATVAAAPAATPAYTTQSVGSTDAGNQVKGPAIFLLVLAILDVLASSAGIGLMTLGHTPMTFPGMSSESAELQEKIGFMFSLPTYILGVILAVLRLIGSIKMMNLQSYGLAMTAAILTLIPCGTCCCFLNIGAGIWALVVLAKPEVKSSFH